MPSSYFLPCPSFFQIGPNLLNISPDCSQNQVRECLDIGKIDIDSDPMVIFQDLTHPLLPNEPQALPNGQADLRAQNSKL